MSQVVEREVLKEPAEGGLGPPGGSLSPRQKVTLLVVAAIVLLAFLFLVRAIVVPFIWAIVLAYVFNPVVNWVAARSRLPRLVVISGMYLVVGGAVAALLVTFLPDITREMADFRRDFPTIISDLEARVLGQQRLELFGLNIDAKTVAEAVSNYLSGLPGGAVSVVTGLIEFLGKALIFVVATFYLLLDGRRIARGAASLIPASYREELVALGREINQVLGAYIRGQLFLIVFMSLATWVILGPVLKLRFALVISIATGILEIIPIVGPIAAGTIAATVGLLQENAFGWPNWFFTLVIIGVYTGLRHMEDYLVIPNVIGRIVRIHPLLALFALFSGALLGGVLGMLLAVPAAAVARILAQYGYRKLVA